METFWAGDVPLSELGPDNESIYFIHHPSELFPLAVWINEEWHSVITDQRGEAIDLIRLRDGVIVWSAEPRGFDSIVVADQLAGRFAFRAPGQYFDIETSLLYNRARYYDPADGRFLTPDPLGPGCSPNLYLYCLNQPFAYTDVLGLAPRCATKAECDQIFDDIKETVEKRKPPPGMKGLEQRWDEMANATNVLPWGIPAVTPRPPMGTVKGHIDQYKGMQNRLSNQMKDYNSKGCQAHEDAAREDARKYYQEWQTEKVKLSSIYGTL